MLNPLLDDRYQILALIGEGGMGRVYRAEQVRVGREVAVKLIREDRPIDARAYRQFVEEARACSALQHPNVVTVHDFGQTAEGTLYLVMELLQGQLLSSAIRSGEVSLQRAVTIASQICAGLSAAHAIGIVHQDLKPSNVMLCSPDGVGELAKILDFGIAGLVNQPRPDRAVRGSPPYMSPEQIRGGRVDSRSDIYAVGATLFEMFTGRPPFEGSVEDILAQHCEAPPPSLLGVVPVAVAQLVSACLAKLPEERPRSVGLLQEALASVRVEGQEAHPEIAAPTGAATATLGTLAEGEVSTTGSSWSAEVLGEALPGAPEMIVREVLEGLPSRSVMLAAADGATLRVRRMTLERPARRWEVELALERWFTPLSTLEHAAVAGWQRRWWDGDVLYLAGPPLEGEGLDVLLHRQGRLPPDQALFVAQGVCQGLTALHTLGVVHGDLRPGTVRVGEGTMLAEPGSGRWWTTGPSRSPPRPARRPSAARPQSSSGCWGSGPVCPWTSTRSGCCCMSC